MRQWMIDRLIEALIEREGGYVNHPADRGGPTRFGITEAVARAHGYRGRDAPAAARRGDGDLPPALLAAAALRRGRQARAAHRRRTVRHRRQHGAGGRRDLPPARADRAQPQRQGLSRSGSRRPHRRRARWPRSTASSTRAASAAARPCCCARSRRCRASAISAWPSAARPMRPFSTAGWRTGSARAERQNGRRPGDFSELRNVRRKSPWPFSKPSSPRCRSCSTRSSPIRRRATAPSSN